MFKLSARFKTMPGIPVIATSVPPLELRKVLPAETDREEFYLALIEVLGNQLAFSPHPNGALELDDEDEPITIEVLGNQLAFSPHPNGALELDDEDEPITYADLVIEVERYKRIANDACAERAELYRKLKLLNISQGSTASVEARLQMLIDGLNELADLK